MHRTLHMTVAAFVSLYGTGALAWQPIPVKEDPLVRMPGTQPGQVSLESPGRCLNCHGDYNKAVEPGFNWKGSMMAQAARDPLFFACMTVAAQDSIWATGRPNATDICLRCHSPKAWLEGRSDPTNASAFSGSDWDGLSCDFCHRMYDPFYARTYDGSREGNDWNGYWDEGAASMTLATQTRDADALEAQAITRFNGSPFFDTDAPFSPSYTEATSGQYFVAGDSAKRASFADAAARHQMAYSRFHKSKYMCATCHDVSNPVLANIDFGDTPPNDGTTNLPTEQYAAHAYMHVERTFSEFMLSDYGQAGGAIGIGPFAPDVFETSLPGNRIGKCQDCHMRDVVGAGCNKNGVPTRPDDSAEHPLSGQPLHDLTGGNAWIPWILASIVPGSSNYDATNAALLHQGPAVLTLDPQGGVGLDPDALLAGSQRAMQQLSLAASINALAYDRATGALSFEVQNHTGHRLISGFPEGRRMFVNIKVFAGGELVYEVNPYDEAVGTLRGLPAGGSPSLGANEVYDDALVYETHPKSDLTGEDETFHFALATGRYKDNRIPPKGFRITEAAARQSVPVWHGVEDESYYSAAEYAGGYDAVALTVPTGADAVEVDLFYQTTSREYVAFLRDQINGTGTTLSSPTPSGEPNAYIIQSDPFFAQLKAWGNTIWELWWHNKDVPGAAPILMATATVGSVPQGCTAPAPTLQGATSGHSQVTLVWSDEHSADDSVIGYRLYYDQAGKSQLVTDVGPATSHTDDGLTNGQEYCYKIATRYADCESAASNVLCATPSTQANAEIGAAAMETGESVTSGKGKNSTTTFFITDAFTQGGVVTFQVYVIDTQTGLRLPDAVVDLEISGPSLDSITSSPSDPDGIAVAAWSTSAPRKNSAGTPTGIYTATVIGITGHGYVWDGVPLTVSFTLE